MEPKRCVNLSAMIGNAQLCTLIQPTGSSSSSSASPTPPSHCSWKSSLSLGCGAPSLGCEGYLVARYLFSPVSSTLFSLLLPPLLHEPYQPHPRGCRGGCPEVSVLWLRNNVLLDTAGAPELPVLGHNSSWHCSDGRRGAATRGQGEGPRLEGICSQDLV